MLNILLEKKFLTLKQKYSLVIAHRDLSHLHKTELAKIAYKNLSLKISEIEESHSIYFNCLTVQNLLKKTFAATKTAEHGLSFIKKDDEVNLCNIEQTEDIIHVFKLIYILIDEDTVGIEKENLIENLISNIMPKYNIVNLSKMQNNFRAFIYRSYGPTYVNGR